ncbi:MAG: 5-formyltetrahydrofolate cyclo-ligase [Paramuribaculum sp.]|nr:5-formyltetrahydrofolate cyclo-ligase [Paramuribaculum sp.]
MNKNDIRRRVKARKNLLTDPERESAARRVFDRFEQLAAFAMSEHILIYHSLPDELSTLSFLEKWNNSKHFYLPRVNGVNLELLPYEKTSLKMGAFQIEEPSGDDIVDPDRIDLIIVPGVAYDRNGNRVGRGKGFYDRLLGSTRAFTIGVGYDFQLVNEIETDPFDVPVDMVITESQAFLSPRRRR